jgi:5-methylthioadenosine/S-adenosylhomocysteine deaminase
MLDFIVSARHLLPIDQAPLTDHSLLVKDGRIVGLCPNHEAHLHPAQEVLERDVVMPGLVNVHTHSAMSLLRGLADDLPLMDWLQGHIWPAEGQHVSAQFCEDGVNLAMVEMLESGTTTFNDMYFFPESTVKAAQAAQMRLCVGLMLIDFPTAYGAGPAEYLDKGRALHAAVQGQPLIKTLLAPHAPYTVNDDSFQAGLAFAKEAGLGIHLHLHETAFEVESVPVRPYQRLKALGVLDQRLLAVHCTQLLPEEIQDMAARGMAVAHCPESNLKLASGFCPVRDLLAAGVGVGLGTDGAASNNDLDLFGEMRTAALIAKGVTGDATAVSARQALYMATLGGATALGWQDEIGSLTVGKAADFITIDLDKSNTTPLYNVESHLVYALNSRQVRDSFVAGKALMRDQRLLTLDVEGVKAKARGWREKIGQ